MLEHFFLEISGHADFDKLSRIWILRFFLTFLSTGQFSDIFTAEAKNLESIRDRRSVDPLPGNVLCRSPSASSNQFSNLIKDFHWKKLFNMKNYENRLLSMIWRNNGIFKAWFNPFSRSLRLRS